MPIKGLTDNLMPAFPRLGKLRKGGAATVKTRHDGSTYTTYGQDLSYFRFTSERPEVLQCFEQAYGTQPQTLLVFLPYASLDDNWQTWQEEWKAGGLVHRCDGQEMTIWRKPDGSYSTQPKPCPYALKPELRTANNPGCTPVGRLTLILPALLEAGHVGYITLETHSFHDIMAIQQTLLAVEQARRQHPQGLLGVPFLLRRVPETISTPAGNGQRVRRKKWLVKLEPVADWVVKQLELARQETLLLSTALPATTTTAVVDPRTGEVLEPPEEEEDGETDEENENPDTPGAETPAEPPAAAPPPTGEPPVASPAASPAVGLITPAQRRQLFDLARRLYGADLTEFKTWLQQRYQVQSSAALTTQQAAEIMGLLAAELAPEPPTEG